MHCGRFDVNVKVCCTETKSTPPVMMNGGTWLFTYTIITSPYDNYITNSRRVHSAVSNSHPLSLNIPVAVASLVPREIVNVCEMVPLAVKQTSNPSPDSDTEYPLGGASVVTTIA